MVGVRVDVGPFKGGYEKRNHGGHRRGDFMHHCGPTIVMCGSKTDGHDCMFTVAEIRFLFNGCCAAAALYMAEKKRMLTEGRVKFGSVHRLGSGGNYDKDGNTLGPIIGFLKSSQTNDRGHVSIPFARGRMPFGFGRRRG
jgi:hypothetical protein